MEKNENVKNALVAGLALLNDDDIRVPSSKIETIAYFKDILKALLNGQLVLADPESLKSAEQKEDLKED